MINKNIIVKFQSDYFIYFLFIYQRIVYNFRQVNICWYLGQNLLYCYYSTKKTEIIIEHTQTL